MNIFKGVASVAVTISLLVGTAWAGLGVPTGYPSDYIALGENYPCVGQLNGIGPGSGTLISPIWVLTAAHNVVDPEGNGTPIPPNWPVQFMGYDVTEIVVYPTFLADWPNNRNPNDGWDLALVSLTRALPPSLIPPAALYRGSNEKNSTAVLVGYGLTGYAPCGCGTNPSMLSCQAQQNYGTRRAGRNVIDLRGNEYIPDWSDRLLLCDLDSPSSQSASVFGGRSPVNLEFTTCEGDSGGGLFVGSQLAGVHSFIYRRNGTYGTVMAATSVSSLAWWIDQVTSTIAYGRDSEATVTVGAGCVWHHDQWLTVGYGVNATGALIIDSGGVMTTSEWLNLGWNSGSSGTVLLSGLDSFLKAGVFNVGTAGYGRVTVQDEAGLEFDELNLGRDVESSGECLLTEGSHATGGGIRVGWQGNGVLIIDGEACCDTVGGHVGFANSSEGQVILSGENSSMSVAVFFNVADEGTASVDISGGARMSVSGWLNQSAEPSGVSTITVAESSSHLSADVFNVGQKGHASLHVTESAELTFGELNLGRSSTASVGIVLIDHAAVVEGNMINSGMEGCGTVIVEHGGTLSAEAMAIGSFRESNGLVVVRDSESSASIAGGVVVGGEGRGSLSVEGGAVVVIGELLIIGQHGEVGTAGGSIAIGPGVVGAATDEVSIGANGYLGGSGRVAANIVNGGTLAIGHPPGAAELLVQGQYTQWANGVLSIEIGGAVEHAWHDKLHVSGHASLDGVLSVILVGDYQPKVGDRFDTLSFGGMDGGFSELRMPNLAVGIWGVRYGATGIELIVTISPDLDRDGDVDAEDLAIFMACLSGAGIPHNGNELCRMADLDDDGDVDQSDFGALQRCFSGEGASPDPECMGW